jgi:hypothetical protein
MMEQSISAEECFNAAQSLLLSLSVSIPHPLHAKVLFGLAECFRSQRDFEKSIDFHEAALSMILQMYFYIRWDSLHIEVCESLLYIAIARTDFYTGNSKVGELKASKEVGELVTALGQDIVPLLRKSLGDSHPMTIYAKGNYGGVTKLLGGEVKGNATIEDAMTALLKERVSELGILGSHPWIKRLESLLNKKTL